MNRLNSPDALVRISLTATKDGGSDRPIFDNARPQYKLLFDGEPYQTSASHKFLYSEGVWPNGSAIAYVFFITPEYYPQSLSPGDVVDVCAGSRVFGSSVILDVFNAVLLKDAPLSICRP